MAHSKGTSHPNVNPKDRCVEMLKEVYAVLPEKDMTEGQFIKESLAAIKQHKDRKNSPLILPD
jgi:hypothetical protein